METLSRRTAVLTGPHLFIQPVGHDGGRLVLLSIADGSDPQGNLRQQRETSSTQVCSHESEDEISCMLTGCGCAGVLQ